MKKYLYFQPEYVSKFKCDGGGCNARCCKGWMIYIDAATYKKYSRIQPKSKAKEITSHIKFDSEKKKNIVALDEKNGCPFLNENNLCSLQLEYGEKFLSQTCATYPRITAPFGKFFERSLTLTCPVVAEMILFAEEPMKFEFVEVPEKVHSNHGKITSISSYFPASEKAAEQMLSVQVAIISILQERTLSIDQRLISLCFFVDKLEEIYSHGIDEDELKKLIAAYESKEFLAEQMPLMIQSVNFDAEKFIRLMMEMFEAFYGAKEFLVDEKGRIFLNTVTNTLQIKPDENNFISLSTITANYEQLAEARKKFFADYSTFLENYLVNELFLNLYPWKYNRLPTRSISVFLIIYKVFELLTFAAIQNNLSSKNDLLKLVDWYTNQIDHSDRLQEKIFAYLEEHKDFFELMETLLKS